MNSVVRWLAGWLWPRAALSNVQADVAWLRVEIPAHLHALEARMSAREDETRAELSSAIDGALSAYDAKAAECEQYKTALEQADADKAAAVAAAVAEANEANDALDSDFNVGQVEKLRRLQPVVVEPEQPSEPESPSEPGPAPQE